MDNVFVAPHFDDVVFSCGGLAAMLAAQGQRSRVVTVFGGVPASAQVSDFARSVHRKWKLDDPVRARRKEDANAIAAVGGEVVHLDYLDAFYRTGPAGRPLYNSYDSLKAAPAAEDEALPDSIGRDLLGLASGPPPDGTRFLFPLGVGNHVDHELVRRAGRLVLEAGYDVLWYEELPYSEMKPHEVDLAAQKLGPGRQSLVLPIDLAAKIRAVACYPSQILGIGGTVGKASKRFRAYAFRVGGDRPCERIWVHEGSAALTELHELNLRSCARRGRGVFRGLGSAIRGVLGPSTQARS